MKRGRHGELIPLRGFSRVQHNLPLNGSAWVAHTGLLVLSTLEQAHLPGSGEPPLTGPQWLVSVSKGRTADRRCSPGEALHVVACFGMPSFDEDNHHPGIARHLWCPVDSRYQQMCECKLTEVSITDGDYTWTTDVDGDCRGCEYERLTGRVPCPLHPPQPT